MPNAQLAQRILNEITAHPEAFNMADWCDIWEEEFRPSDDAVSCGTTMCVAGWACHLEGYTLGDGIDGSFAFKPGEKPEHIQAVALRLLDLPDSSLFFTSEEVATHLLRQLAAGNQLDWEAAKAAVEDT